MFRCEIGRASSAKQIFTAFVVPASSATRIFTTYVGPTADARPISALEIAAAAETSPLNAAHFCKVSGTGLSSVREIGEIVADIPDVRGVHRLCFGNMAGGRDEIGGFAEPNLTATRSKRRVPAARLMSRRIRQPWSRVRRDFAGEIGFAPETEVMVLRSKAWVAAADRVETIEIEPTRALTFCEMRSYDNPWTPKSSSTTM